MMTKAELNALLESDDSLAREKAVAQLVGCLISADKATRERGYAAASLTKLADLIAAWY